ncbi:LOW QUALITY PROTEIN: hypothetical protein BRADI_2g37631v3 [Brachypodium distachyon]|uniref:Uncharacterized protein n=1 Tax=Brachypodium distachyon TaxID=15368 RepID=A0A2K2DCD9_BRADI|nr:LOW QUALITY PROTEIN: hypothetical protein BRADI_2g37631v3 [Brachypodium distachyon]
MRQHVSAGSNASMRRELGPQRVPNGAEHLHLHRLRQSPNGGPVEHLHHGLVRVLDERDVMEPDPVIRDPVAVDEEPGEEQEVCQDRHNHRVAEHDVRHDGREERDEAAPGPERSEDDEGEEAEGRRAAGQPDGEEGGDGEGEREDDERREGDDGVGQHVGGAAVGVVRRLPEVDVALLDEHRQRVGADVEHGGHPHGEEPHTLLDPLGRVVEPEEDRRQDEAGHHDRRQPHPEELRQAARTSIASGFAYVGTDDDGDDVVVDEDEVLPATSLPRKTLSAMACSSDMGVAALLAGTTSELCAACHVALNSASGDDPWGSWRSSSRMVSSANSAGFSLSGIGSPYSEKKGFNPAGLPAPPTGEQHELVQNRQDPRTRLMDRHHDHTPALRDVPQHLDHHERAGGVQPGGRLVEEEEDRVVDDVDPDGHAAALPAGHPAVGLVADDGVRGPRQAQLVDQGVHAGPLLGFGQGAREAELGGELERLPDGEHRVEEVVLHHVGGDGPQAAAVERLAVEGDGAVEAVTGDAAGERVEQGGFPRAAGPHDREELAADCGAGDAGEEGLRVRGRRERGREGGVRGGGQAVAAAGREEMAGGAPGLLDAVGEVREGQHVRHRWEGSRRRRGSRVRDVDGDVAAGGRHGDVGASLGVSG